MEEIDGRIIILILFVVISAIRWLFEKIKGTSEQPHEIPEDLENIYEDFREEIRQRQTNVQQQQQTPPPLPSSPPPVTHQAQDVQRIEQAPAQAKLHKPKERKLSSEEKAALAKFQQHSQGKRQRKRGPSVSVRALLSSPQSTKQAIILSEILGKPKSMQDA